MAEVHPQANFSPHGHIWQGLEILLMVASGALSEGEHRVHIVVRGQDAAAEHATKDRAALHLPPQQRITWSKMLVVPQLKNWAIEE